MAEMKLNCLIIDDEPVARKGLQEYVDEIDFLQRVASCENALKASHYLNQQRIDLIYLDIHMPRLSGIEFLKTLKHPPLTIFTTAFENYALEGYTLDVIDYLVKPITFDRFLKASQKALEYSQLRSRAANHAGEDGDYFFVRCDSKFEKVLFRDVSYVEALQNYTVIHTAGRKLITYITLTSLETQLPGDRFLKVHKSFLVSVPHIRAIEGNEIILDNARIPISRNLKEEVVRQILGNRLFKR
ncbi:MAG TPA: LytTR family DNA-binding domain-containing protein [Chryseosolibacter sp.]